MTKYKLLGNGLDNILLVIIVLFFLSFNYKPYIGTSQATVVVGDDADYLSHAMSIGLDFDLDYSNEISAKQKKRLSDTPDGPVGPGLLAAPFVAAFSIIDRINNHPVIEDRLSFAGSWTKFGFQISASFYFMLAVFIFYIGANKIEKIYKTENFLLCISFGLGFYLFTRPTMTHVFEFFASSLIFLGAIKFSLKDGNNKTNLMLISFGSVLVILCRIYAFGIFLLPFIIYLSLLLAKDKKIELKKIKNLFIAQLIAACVSILILKKIVPAYSGSAEVTELITSTMHKFSLVKEVLVLPKNTFLIIFSDQFGLLYFAPLFVFGLIFYGMWLLRQKRNVCLLMLTVLTIVYVGTLFGVVSFWKSHASAYGYRYLFTLFPLAYLGYIVWKKDVMLSKGIKRSLIIALFCITYFSGFAAPSYFASNFTPIATVNIFNKFTYFTPVKQLQKTLSAILAKDFYIHVYYHSYWNICDKDSIPPWSTQSKTPAYIYQRNTMMLFWLLALCHLVYYPRLSQKRPSLKALSSSNELDL